MSGPGEFRDVNLYVTMKPLQPRPGSQAAIDKGCACPVLDNAHGAGRFGIGEKSGWLIVMGCAVHDPIEEEGAFA